MATQKGTNGDDVMVGLIEDDVMIGRGGDDSMVADIGNDTLIGGAGNDTMEGAFGNDTASYIRSAGGVRADLTEQTASGGAGHDVFITIENLTGSRFSDVLIGDDGANRLVGSGGGDRLLGRAGNDVLHGGKGRDLLDGGSGADVLGDGRGRDVMFGGGGADRFVFDDESHIRADRIGDLNNLDVIDLAQVDANDTAAADQAFHLVNKFGGTAGELRVDYSARHDWTKVLGDIDGDGESDFTIRIDGNREGFDNFVF
jgi:serralysin